MWQITIVVNRDEKPKMSELGTVLDLADSVDISPLVPLAIRPKREPMNTLDSYHIDSNPDIQEHLGKIQDRAHAAPITDTVSTDQMDAAREEGREAYDEGGGLDDNPYAAGSILHNRWQEGFTETWGHKDVDTSDEHLC